jgi:hypothetical protein
MIKGKPCLLCNAKTKWPFFRDFLLLKTILNKFIQTDDDNIRTVESINNAVQQVT